MRLTRVERASALIEAVLSGEQDDNLVTLCAMITPAQKQLVEGLAQQNRVSQAVILRAIIDEWCETQMDAAQ